MAGEWIRWVGITLGCLIAQIWLYMPVDAPKVSLGMCA